MIHIASGLTPPAPHRTVSKPKLDPESMEHWTPDLCTQRGERVPRHLVAYAVGAAFPVEHLRPIAEAVCSPEMLDKHGDNHLGALLFHLIDTGKKMTLLHVQDSATRRPFTLWVHRVFPGLPHGQEPPRHLSEKSWALFHDYLKQRGVSDEVRESMRMCCIEWPKGAAYPVWVPESLLNSIREQERLRRQQAELERDGTATMRRLAAAAP